MTTTILYLLRAEFIDTQIGDTSFYCPQCLQVEGLLAVYPQVRQNLDIRYVDFERPRGGMAKFVGANQSCPQLVHPTGDDEYSIGISEAGVSPARKIEKVDDILSYLINRFALPQPHP